MFHRIINPLLSNSFFLFGARGTGKTKLIEALFADRSHFSIDLLDEGLARTFRKNPALLKARFQAFQKERVCDWIVLDEVQKAPPLLSIAHQMIEKNQTMFALTGSSARKLKRGGANLLAGRAFVYHLFPLTFTELGARFQIGEILQFGSLPKLFSYQNDFEKKKYLSAYIQTYVKEEILMEQAVRNLDPFQDFLQISAQMSSKVINYAKIAKDTGVDAKTITNYFSVLEETWMGFRLPGYHRSIRKAQMITPKFYWFDLGVRRTLEQALDIIPVPGTSYYGECFEELVVNEIFRLNHYSEKNYRLSYLATSNSRTEVDVILEKGKGREHILIEIKSAETVDEKEVNKLIKLRAEFCNAQVYYLSQCTEAQIVDDVQCLHWCAGLKKIFGC